MKKFVAIVLVVSVILCSMSVFVQAVVDTEDTFAANDLAFAQALGIIDENVDGNAGVTRGELATILSRIVMNLQNSQLNLSAYECCFLDVPQEIVGDVNCVSALAIMNGTSETTFSPDRNVTYSELSKVIVSMLGYGEQAQTRGGYPSGYIYMAISLNINDDKISDVDATITYNAVATMLKKAVNVKMQQKVINSSGTNWYYDSQEKSYLERYMGIANIRGVLSANSLVDATGETDSLGQWYYVKIGDELFKISNNNYSIRYLLGYTVEVYYRKDDAAVIQEIIYCEAPEINEVFKIFDKDLIGLKDNKINYYDERGQKRSCSISPASTKIIYNDSLCETWNESTINPFNNLLEGWIEVLDNDSDGNIDYVFVNAYESGVTKQVSDDIITFKYRKGKYIDISQKKVGEDIDILNIIKEPISIDEIKDGDVLNIFKDRDGNIKKIIVTIDNMIGKVTMIESLDAGRENYAINDMVFESSVALTQNSQYPFLKVGAVAKVFLNMNMRICDIEINDFEQKRFAYVYACVREPGLDDKYKIKLFTDAGVFETYEIADKITLNDISGRKGKDVINALGTESGSAVRRQLVIFKTNADMNKITELTIWDGNTDTSSDKLYRYPGYDGVTERTAYRISSSSFGAELLLSNSTVIFSVPSEASRYDEELYTLVNKNTIPDGNTSYQVEAYGTVADDPCADVLIMLNSENRVSTISRNANIAIVESIEKKINSDTGDIENVVNTYVANKKEAYTFESDTLNVFSSNNSGKHWPDIGDVIRINVDKNNKIIYAEPVFEYASSTIYSEGMPSVSNPSNDTFTANPRYSYGMVKFFDGTSMRVELNSAGSVVTESFLAGNFDYLLCEKVKDGLSFTPASASNLRSAEVFGDVNASRVFLYQREGYSVQAIIYND